MGGGLVLISEKGTATRRQLIRSACLCRCAIELGWAFRCLPCATARLRPAWTRCHHAAIKLGERAADLMYLRSAGDRHDHPRRQGLICAGVSRWRACYHFATQLLSTEQDREAPRRWPVLERVNLFRRISTGWSAKASPSPNYECVALPAELPRQEWLERNRFKLNRLRL